MFCTSFATMGVVTVLLTGGQGGTGGGTITTKDGKVKIVANDVSKLSLEKYENDVFSMKKPKEWTVESAGVGIYYAIKVYNPKDTNEGIFLMLKMQPLLKSAAAKNIGKIIQLFQEDNIVYLQMLWCLILQRLKPFIKSLMRLEAI